MIGAITTCLGALGAPASARTAPRVDRKRLTIDNTWRQVDLSTTYADPVVFALPPSANGGDPCSTRVRAVTGDGFDVALEEWRYLDGWHTVETVGCLATKRGVHSYPDGTSVELGRVSSSTNWTSIDFQTEFSTTPVVLTAAQTRNGHHPIVSRIRGVDTDGMALRLQEEEAEGNHKHEAVGYLAIEPGTGVLDGGAYEAGVTSVDGGWASIPFATSYDEPVFLAGIQSFDGPDTATLRYRNLTATGVEVRVEEERSADDEAWHRGERVGYLVLERATTGTGGYGLDGYGAGGYGA